MHKYDSFVDLNHTNIIFYADPNPPSTGNMPFALGQAGGSLTGLTPVTGASPRPDLYPSYDQSTSQPREATNPQSNLVSDVASRLRRTLNSFSGATSSSSAVVHQTQAVYAAPESDASDMVSLQNAFSQLNPAQRRAFGPLFHLMATPERGVWPSRRATVDCHLVSRSADDRTASLSRPLLESYPVSNLLALLQLLISRLPYTHSE
jgi:hypothetical protein